MRAPQPMMVASPGAMHVKTKADWIVPVKVLGALLFAGGFFGGCASCASGVPNEGAFFLCVATFFVGLMMFVAARIAE